MSMHPSPPSSSSNPRLPMPHLKRKNSTQSEDETELLNAYDGSREGWGQSSDDRSQPPTTAGPAFSSSATGKRRRAEAKSDSKPKSCCECRRLKLKCDRTFPCSSCKKRGLADICPLGELKNAKSREEELQRRVHELEEALQQATSAQSSRPSSSGGELEGLRQGPLDIDKRSSEERTVSPPRALDQTSKRGMEKEEKAEELDEVTPPATGHLAISGIDPGASKFFGSGGSAYMLETGDAPLPDVDCDKGWINAFAFERSSNKAEALEALHRQLPSRRDAVQFAHMYFQNVAWGTHIVDGDTFDDDYLSHVYSLPKAEIRPQRLAVVFAVLALGTLFDLRLPHGSPQARVYFKLCRACLAIDSSGSLNFIQSVHLMATFLSNSGKVTDGGDAAWPLIGQGIRTAQQLGLHRDGLNWEGVTEKEANERRRVFWEIFAYDVMQCLAQGRPRTIMAFTVDTRLPDVASCAPKYHVERYKMVQHIALINDEQIRTKPSSHRVVMEIDQSVRNFMKQLPEELLADLCDEEISFELTDFDKTKLLQSHTMQLHIHGALLLLHRRHFAQALREHPAEPLESRCRSSYLAVLECSRAIILVVIRLVRVPFELISRRWFFFFHAFSACVSLAAAIISAPSAVHSQEAFESLDMGVRLFEAARKIDYLPLLERLRQRAANSMSSQSNTLMPLPTKEEIDVLGSGTTLHRSRPTSSSRSTVSTSAVPEFARPFSLSAFASGHVPGSHPPLADYSLLTTPSPTDQPLGEREGGMGIASGSLQEFFATSVEGEGRGTVNFDFDAFMSTLGVSNPEGGPMSFNLGQTSGLASQVAFPPPSSLPF